MQTITRYIENKLGLIVNVEKSKVARPRDIKYLGFGFYNKKGMWRPKPHLKSVQKFKSKLKDITSRSNAKFYKYCFYVLNIHLIPCLLSFLF